MCVIVADEAVVSARGGVRIAILGARSLSSYTERILSRGFAEIGWELVSPAEASFLLVQLHGAPHSVEDDLAIVELLPVLIAKERIRGYGLLIHRPDEIQSRTELFSNPKILADALFVALLGTMHLQDDWLVQAGVPVHAISHGFVSSKPPPLRAPLVVGSHTRRGEMRRVDDAATLIVNVLNRSEPGSVVGYIGGEGAEMYGCGASIATSGTMAADSEIEIVSDYGMVRGAARKRVLVVNPRPIQPPELRTVFNVQLYHLNGRLRTGENSGSLHHYPSIPIIFEMNGAEVMEDLKVIRVPYKNGSHGVIGDFSSAADEIIDWIQTDRLKKSLRHNQRRAEALGPSAVARAYQELFESLAES